MVLLAIASLFLGVLYGLSGTDLGLITILVSHTDFILYILMFLVGISVGMHRGIIDKIKEYHIKIFIIPVGIIVGSIAGGLVCAAFLPLSLGESTAIASGLGWYSLAGVSITNLYGAAIGSAAFLSNLMREIFSFFSIPWISKHLNYYSCIAPAAATSEDTTLPMLIKYTNPETVVLAVFNGAFLSALVPFLISFCYHIF